MNYFHEISYLDSKHQQTKLIADFRFLLFSYISVQFSSVAQLFPNVCNHMDHSVPGLPVHHQLPEFAQTHFHRVGNTIQPSHPLLSPSPPAFNISQHQGLIMIYFYETSYLDL